MSSPHDRGAVQRLTLPKEEMLPGLGPGASLSPPLPPLGGSPTDRDTGPNQLPSQNYECDCGAPSRFEGHGPPPHGSRFRCTKGHVWWARKRTAVKRTKEQKDNAWDFKRQWKERMGGVLCSFCGATPKTHQERSYQVDHVRRLIDGGDDVIWNTQILCGLCHTLKGQMTARESHRRNPEAEVEGW